MDPAKIYRYKKNIYIYIYIYSILLELCGFHGYVCGATSRIMTWWSPVSTSNIVIAIRGCCQRRRVSANGDRPYLLVILLMAEIMHQLIGPVGFSHCFKRGLYIPGSAGFLPSTVLILLMEETLPHLKTKKPDLVSLICSVYSRSNQYGFKLTWNPQNWWFVHVFPFPSGHFQVPRCFFFLGGGCIQYLHISPGALREMSDDCTSRNTINQ